MLATKPIFVIGSGRSGTRTIYKMLKGTESIEIHHEFACETTQRIAVLSHLGLISESEVTSHLNMNHASAAYWSESSNWIDSSNKLTWIVEPLINRFPNARFLHLVRDGRKVTSSYFRKLAHEMYDDESVRALNRWLEDQSLPMPPPEKRYWWNIPIGEMPFASQFPSFNHYQRTVYHWVESTRVAEESMRACVPASQQLTLRLEDLTSNREVLSALCDFIGVPANEDYWSRLQRPENVIVPLDLKLTPKQRVEFNALAGKQMSFFGYDLTQEEYRVEY